MLMVEGESTLPSPFEDIERCFSAPPLGGLDSDASAAQRKQIEQLLRQTGLNSSFGLNGDDGDAFAHPSDARAAPRPSVSWSSAKHVGDSMPRPRSTMELPRNTSFSLYDDLDPNNNNASNNNDNNNNNNNHSASGAKLEEAARMRSNLENLSASIAALRGPSSASSSDLRRTYSSDLQRADASAEALSSSGPSATALIDERGRPASRASAPANTAPSRDGRYDHGGDPGGSSYGEDLARRGYGESHDRHDYGPAAATRGPHLKGAAAGLIPVVAEDGRVYWHADPRAPPTLGGLHHHAPDGYGSSPSVGPHHPHADYYYGAPPPPPPPPPSAYYGHAAGYHPHHVQRQLGPSPPGAPLYNSAYGSPHHHHHHAPPPSAAHHAQHFGGAGSPYAAAQAGRSRRSTRGGGRHVAPGTPPGASVPASPFGGGGGSPHFSGSANAAAAAYYYGAQPGMFGESMNMFGPGESGSSSSSSNNNILLPPSTTDGRPLQQPPPGMMMVSSGAPGGAAARRGAPSGGGGVPVGGLGSRPGSQQHLSRGSPPAEVAGGRGMRQISAAGEGLLGDRHRGGSDHDLYGYAASNGTRSNPGSSGSLNSLALSMNTTTTTTPGGSAESVRGRVAQLCRDQHGSRYLQAHLDGHVGDAGELEIIFDEVLDKARELTTDVFGNYVVQKVLATGDAAVRAKVATKLRGHAVALSLHVYGCRVIQKALEALPARLAVAVIREFEGHVLLCVHDVNGNHVIQKCVEITSAARKAIDLGIPFRRKGKPRPRQSHHRATASAAAATTIPGGVLLATQRSSSSDEDAAVAAVAASFGRQPPPGGLVVGHDDGSASFGDLGNMHDTDHEAGDHTPTTAGTSSESVYEDTAEDIATLGAQINFVLGAFVGQARKLAIHPYGCRVLQRVLEHCSAAQTGTLLDELRDGQLRLLIEDQYANYVMQHAIQYGRDQDRALLVGAVRASLADFSRHKFASNVVEKCLEYGSPQERSDLIDEIVADRGAPANNGGANNNNNNNININININNINTTGGAPSETSMLRLLITDPFANYVVQKVVDLADDHQVANIVARLKPVAQHVRHTPGKHILTRLEKKVAIKF